MDGKPDYIPVDVWKSAISALSHKTLGNLYAGPRVVKVAEAILAERKRCADLLRHDAPHSPRRYIYDKTPDRRIAACDALDAAILAVAK